ncbi:RCC1 BLIP-II [Pyrrhoderma noxium]|uniref:RCC1 BLIP-II n=1 Tax=Pyrrhoderma noxium TaxID=2282107 RepID=A0A286UTS0_9AGAM|nr:RCC1 BLIP-II [Pyrrhoderma noxium]
MYLWGHAQNGRMGIPGVSYGIESPMLFVPLSDRPISNLYAGGWSYMALDHKGRLYAWGAMNGGYRSHHYNGFESIGKTSERPLRLEMPDLLKSVSCGRAHAAALDVRGHVWMFLNWGQPFWFSTRLLDNTSPESTPIQVVSSWDCSAILTESGSVLVLWLDERRIFTSSIENEPVRATDHIIQCSILEACQEPFLLPSIPGLPLLYETDSPDSLEVVTKLVKIAAMNGALIGLTDKGHVLKMNNFASGQSHYEWTYLPQFSEPARISSYLTSSLNEPGNIPPRDIRMTDIVAQHLQFYAFTSHENTIVLRGNKTTNPSTAPDIIPQLSYKGVKSISIGDYHCIALTVYGKVYTWGRNLEGSLGFQAEGTGDHPPTEVVIPLNNGFCIGATAGGWHTGVLAIELNGIDDTSMGNEPWRT